MSVTIYHNPRCSKSRQTLALLEERGVSPEIVLYLETPPTPGELKDILAKLGKDARDIIRTKEEPYDALGLADESKSNRELIQAMTENPALIERPIVVKGDKAAVGRPPEAVLDIL